VEHLKELPDFQREDGTFDAAYYNQWVEAQLRRGFNWDELYDQLAADVNRQQFIQLFTAGARIVESDLRDQFEREHTRYQVKAVEIQPEVELSDVEIRAHYDANRESYQTPEMRVAEFVKWSLEPPIPAMAGDLIERARAGEDFAELATEYSEDPSAEAGGDMGWLVRTEETPEHLLPLFDMDVGAVTEPVRRLTSVRIYKVIDARTNADADQRDVHVRQIVLYPELSDELRAERADAAQTFFVAVTEAGGDLRTIAEQQGLSVTKTEPFGSSAATIAGVDTVDIFDFRTQTAEKQAGEVTEVIEAQNGLYVAKVLEVIPPRPQEFDEVREKVERNAIAAYRNSEPYREQVQAYVDRFVDELDSVDQIAELAPELPIEVKEPQPFTTEDFLFSDGIFWQTREAAALLQGEEPGTVVGPLYDFRQVPNFIELVEALPPSEEDWASWNDERDALRDRSLQALRFERMQDYLRYLEDRYNSEALIVRNDQAILDVLGVDQTRLLESTLGETPAESAPADELGTEIELESVPEPALEEAPAESEPATGEQ
jgi:parvulin-like peptidyl-prolyl isomerase